MRNLFILGLALFATLLFVPAARADTPPWYLDPTWCEGAPNTEAANSECLSAQQVKALAVRSERISSFASEQMDDDHGYCSEPSDYVKEYLDEYQDRVDDEGEQALRGEAFESHAACAVLETEQQRIDDERERRQAARDRKLHRRYCDPVGTTMNGYSA